MYSYTRALLTLGAAFVLVWFGTMLTGQGKALAAPQDFDFTFTSEDTVEVGVIGDTTIFFALLENTGTQIDSYAVTLVENPPTPEDWWREFCAGGTCWDSTITFAYSYLEPGWQDHVELRVMPRSAGDGNFTITVESQLNPGVKMTKSITFIMTVHEPGEGPVTDQWGLIILATLIVASAVYLMYRRYRLARQPYR